MKDFILVNDAQLEWDEKGEIIKIGPVNQLLIPVSKIASVASIAGGIPKNLLDDSVRKQVRKMSDNDFGGSKIFYKDGYEKLEVLIVLETPEAIYNQMYSE